MKSNIDFFNEIVGHLFDNLYKRFPIPIDIDDEVYAIALGCKIFNKTPDNWPKDAGQILEFSDLNEGLSLRPLLYSSLTWLREEGFILAESDSAVRKVRLTARALTILNASPSSLEPKLASKLSEAVKGSAAETGRSMIGEIVGQIVGGVAKGLTA